MTCLTEYSPPGRWQCARRLGAVAPQVIHCYGRERDALTSEALDRVGSVRCLEPDAQGHPGYSTDRSLEEFFGFAAAFAHGERVTMGATITRRSLLSGAATAVGAAAADVRRAQARAAVQPVPGSPPGALVTHVSVPFGASGLMGRSKQGQAYLEQVIRGAIVPPLSQVVIYAHGWLTSASDLMVIYDTLSQGFETQLRTLSRPQAGAAAGVPTAPPLAVPATSVVFTTHWPSRRSDREGPIDLADVVSFAQMEARANLVGETGMARLIGLLWELLLADPLAETRMLLISHSFGGRVLASALHALPARIPDTFTALQTRNRINLVMLQPAMPADALEPTDLTHAHPFGQLVHYQNLRILTTMSQWDTPLVRFYPAQEAQQPADAVYATAPAETRQAVPALGGAGPSDATWRAFNGALPRTDVAVGPGFEYADVLGKAGQRLVVADLSPLHAAHRREDLTRPAGELPPFGRPDRRSMALSGYHNDIYSKEMYQLVIGFAWGQQGL